ncbi:hypothetical protein EJ08DRAFT_666105 [Tothia fuscella]|uniref:C2H2-type domain-containing protein n=1 Tax=Tothia fuscella TaxID=1048955 RepID=A0A9P4TS36_9PEZI|nr:hypothetical protein EJ08DRAFT_666105 [Tothia fuscella]
MDNSRGRSPSAGHQNQSIRHHSPSPNGAFHNPDNNHTGGLGLDHQSVTPFDSSLNSFGNQLTTNNQSSFDANSHNPSFDGNIDFAASAQSFHQGGLYQDQGLQGLPQGLTTDPSFGQQGNNLFSSYGNLGDTSGLNNGFDPPLFPDTGSHNDLFSSGALDPQLLGSQAQQQSINPTNLVNPMTSHPQSPTPPHLLSPAMNRQPSGGSPHGSPALQQSGFQQQPSPRHSRNTSLDPSSAVYPQQMQNGEWGSMGSFQQHRRQPSDAHSDVSSSAHPSPYLGNTLDSFDQVDSHSPLLGAQQDPAMYEGVMGIGQFSISEPRHPSYISPAHSPHISPRLLPQQQQLPSFTSGDNFGMMNSYAPPMNHSQYNGQGQDFFSSQSREAFPTFNQGGIDYNNEAMSPPEINIQLAPPSRQASFEPPKPEGGPDGALSPPDRSRSRNRTRAKSDSSLRGERSQSKADSKDMLSPQAAGVGSRSASPSGKGRRSSTSSVPNRDYILDLADPSRPASAASGDTTSNSKRTQKHPATFQCSLCPKRFTRAYNLRSHLRTHTDERPFVCSVCGKAFARQHDRKRHEGLHSGEKKFVCRGGLKGGLHWGCGRRFARADALGRHFRSEAGRVCIKPLLEEEAIERMNVANREAGLPPINFPAGQQGQAFGQQNQGFEPYPGAPQAGFDPNLQMNYSRLPAALLQQYPTLGGIWDTLPPNGADDVDDNISGANSFDASSGGEYDDEDYNHPQSGWASDVGPQY